ncbi:MAG: tetratricopeptide repeat protein [Candidatus Thorarchaeota archaeon]
MSYLSKDLLHANNLMEEGKFEEAIQVIDNFENREDISLNDKIAYYVLKSSLSFRLFKKDDFLKYAEKAYQESKEQKPSLLLFDAYIEKAHSYIWRLESDKALELIKDCENLLKILNKETPLELFKREANMAWIKSGIYSINNEYDTSLEFAKQSLTLREKLKVKVDLILSYSQIMEIHYAKGEFNKSLEFMNRCLELAKEIDYKIIIQFCFTEAGLIYSAKGELERGLEYHEKALRLAEDLNKAFLIAASLNNLGLIHQQLGNYDKSQSNFEGGLELFKKFGSPGHTVIDSLFHLAIDMNDLEGAKEYIDQLEELKDNFKIKIIDIIYQVDKAILLKSNPRALYRGEAEVILKQIIEEDVGDYDIIIIALLNLCDLLLVELRSLGMLEIIDELKFYISKLLVIAEKNHSYSILAESYLLQAKLALITLDLKDARLLIAKAQSIAEKYNLSRLAMKISIEHDDLLRHLNMWENLQDSKVSIAERLELSGMTEQMSDMIHRHEIEFPKISDEEPVVFLILSQGGRPIFSQLFAKEWEFEDHLLGGFLSAINSFSDEVFAEGLDRAIFGNFTLLMREITPFLMCYLFKGQSYLAQQKLSNFIENFQKNTSLWEFLEKAFNKDQILDSKDLPSLSLLINESFKINNLN